MSEPIGPPDASKSPRYAGISTFARLPQRHEVSSADVSVVGIPFDSGVSYRPGARFGPAHIRQSSRLLRPYNPGLDVAPFAGRQVVDAGDIAANPFHIDEATGRDMSARDYLDAQQQRARFSAVWETFLADVDVLLTPTMPTVAFAAGRLAPPTIAGRALPDSFDAWCALALPANLAGLPAVSVPIGTGRDGLPVGLQVMARRFGDATALRVAACVERDVRGWTG